MDKDKAEIFGQEMKKIRKHVEDLFKKTPKELTREECLIGFAKIKSLTYDRSKKFYYLVRARKLTDAA
jgi:hypothetical protein